MRPKYAIEAGALQGSLRSFLSEDRALRIKRENSGREDRGCENQSGCAALFACEFTVETAEGNGKSL